MRLFLLESNSQTHWHGQNTCNCSWPLISSKLLGVTWSDCTLIWATLVSLLLFLEGFECTVSFRTFLFWVAMSWNLCFRDGPEPWWIFLLHSLQSNKSPQSGHIIEAIFFLLLQLSHLESLGEECEIDCFIRLPTSMLESASFDSDLQRSSAIIFSTCIHCCRQFNSTHLWRNDWRML